MPNWTLEQLKSTKAGAAMAGKSEATRQFLQVPKAVSTDEAKLNKTEQAYLNYIRCLGFTWIGVQNVTLKLAHDTRYTVDFVTVDKNGVTDMREVKGFFRDDAKVKIKVAARMFPWLRFLVVRKTKNGWEHEEVKP
jgi:hypothetical protein